MQKNTRKALKEEFEEEVHPPFDDVSAALLNYLRETGGCSKDDLLKVDAVTKESASLVDKMLEYGLLKKGDNDMVSMTKKGKKVLTLLSKLTEVQTM